MRFDIRRILLQHILMRKFLALAIAVSFVAPLSAQQTRQVKLRSVCFQHSGDLKKLYAISGGEKPKAVEFELFTTVISEEVDAIVTDETLTFGVPDTAGADPTKFKIITKAKAAPGSRQLAIFIPGEPNGSPYRCFVIDDSEKSFPMGSTTAVNLANVPFRLSIGEHQKDVGPGKIENIPMARKTNDRGQVSVIIYIADPATAGGWRAVNQTRWFSGTDKRDLAIGYIHPKTKQPTVNCYGDTPEWIKR